MGCCGCFGFCPKRNKVEMKPTNPTINKRFSEEHLLASSSEDFGKSSHFYPEHLMTSSLSCCLPLYEDDTSAFDNQQSENLSPDKQLSKNFGTNDKAYEASLQNKNYTSRVPVKYTHHVVRSEDFDGNKTINEYVRECKLGTGSYGKVVLHRSKIDGKLYAIKIFNKSRLRKLRVAPSETALMDVQREVDIMKQLDHPNIVNLVEVIDDPESDYLYMVLEYVEGRWIFEGSGPLGGIGESVARKYFRDAASGLMYLHSRNIVHGDIKPENLLISSDGQIKIGDFSVSRTFENNNDLLRRSPGTPVFTAPECCLGSTYHGKAADIWALGVTLYCMVLGNYPFVGESLQDTYDKIVHSHLYLPEDLNADLRNLLEGLLCKDPLQRMKLDAVACHPWVVKCCGPLQEEFSQGI
ncbi:hypothetical protein O6H91_11G050300 [Diphasiastrum complanatum]|uniref:Uncharacterized protein n=1 Tax=Diphasiastrum complanatum TaxID=34168 RepID=A0ACC2CA21_DIPCM|nr:hypothetical protein O6H91_11G050300 [Diphasiastrum complanatum]